MLRVPGRTKQVKLNTTHKIYYNQAPQYLQVNFKKLRTGHNTQEVDTGASYWQTSRELGETLSTAMLSMTGTACQMN